MYKDVILDIPQIVNTGQTFARKVVFDVESWVIYINNLYKSNSVLILPIAMST